MEEGVAVEEDDKTSLEGTGWYMVASGDAKMVTLLTSTSNTVPKW